MRLSLPDTSLVGAAMTAAPDPEQQDNPFAASLAVPVVPPSAIPPDRIELGGGVSVPLAQAEASVRGQANWFFWIAGLSAVNFAMTASGSDTTMVMGLGTPMLVQALGQGLTEGGGIVVGTSPTQVVICAAILGIFVWLGVQGRRCKRWPFFLGMLLYTLDSLIFVVSDLWLAVGFHAFVLFWLWNGLRMAGRIARATREVAGLDVAAA